jgi:hypothetical protein
VKNIPPVHLSCPNCAVRTTLFHPVKTEPPINDIVLDTPVSVAVLNLFSGNPPVVVVVVVVVVTVLFMSMG